MFVTSLLYCSSLPSKCHVYSDKDIAVTSLESFLPSSQFSFLFPYALKIPLLVLSESLGETSARFKNHFRSCHDILRDIFCHVRVLNSDAIYLIFSNILGLSSVIDPFHSSSSIFQLFLPFEANYYFLQLLSSSHPTDWFYFAARAVDQQYFWHCSTILFRTSLSSRSFCACAMSDLLSCIHCRITSNPSHSFHLYL